MTTRRQALQAGGAALILVGTPRIALAADPDPVPPHLLRSAWLGRVGEEVGPGLRLDAVTDVGGAAARGIAGSEDAFVLALSSDAGLALEEGIHPLGDGELFLAPVGMPGARRGYEALVDRAATVRAPVPAPAPPAVAVTGPPGATTEGEPRYRFLRRLRVRRARPGLQVALRLARADGPRTVHVRVERNGTLHARGRAAVRGRRALLDLRVRAPMSRGRYEITVTEVAAGGVRTAVRREIVLR